MIDEDISRIDLFVLKFTKGTFLIDNRIDVGFILDMKDLANPVLEFWITCF